MLMLWSLLGLLMLGSAFGKLPTLPPGYSDGHDNIDAPENCSLWKTIDHCQNPLLRNHSDFNKSCDWELNYYACAEECERLPTSDLCRRRCKVYWQECVQLISSRIEATNVSGDWSSSTDSHMQDEVKSTNLNNQQSPDVQVEGEAGNPLLPNKLLMYIPSVLCTLLLIAILLGFSPTALRKRCGCFRRVLCLAPCCRRGNKSNQVEGQGQGNDEDSREDTEPEIIVESNQDQTVSIDGNAIHSQTNAMANLPSESTFNPDMLSNITSAETYENYQQNLERFLKMMKRTIEADLPYWDFIRQKWEELQSANESRNFHGAVSDPPRLRRQLSIEGCNMPTETTQERERKMIIDEEEDNDAQDYGVVRNDEEVMEGAEHIPLLPTVVNADAVEADSSVTIRTAKQSDLIFYDVLCMMVHKQRGAEGLNLVHRHMRSESSTRQ